MQNEEELTRIIAISNPKVDRDTVHQWAGYLQQLKGCHLYSAASPDIDKDEWLRQRTAGIGGSEIATILGENHWSSPREVWLTKLGIFESNPTQSEPARWGNVLETVVATEWGLRNNRKWVHIPVILQHDDEPWLLANVDGFTLSDDERVVTGILEIKTTSEYNRSYWEDGPLPYNYICQTMWYCGITNLSSIDLVCLVGGQRLYSVELPFDKELFDKEREAARTFWLENVQKGIEPLATSVDVEKVKEVDYDLSAPPIILEEDACENVAEAYVTLREKITALTGIKKALYAQLFLMLGKSSQAITKTHTMSIQATTRRNCDLSLLHEKYPEAYNECVSSSTSVSLNVK